MPIHTVTLPNGNTGYQWGQHGAKYRDRAGAARQAAAAHAHGYEGDELATMPNAGLPAGARRVRGDSNVRQLIRNLIEFFSEEEDEPEHAGDAEPQHAAGVAIQAPDGSMLFMRRKDT